MRTLGLLVAVIFAAGCASVTPDPEVDDPHESFNRSSYEFSDTLDRAVVVPVARTYLNITPDPVHQSILNIFQNLRTVASSFNGFLQGKPDAGAEDFGRFLVNTTLGVGGIFDVASRVGLEYHNEDFGQTLAVWGWQESNFIYVPLLGPSTWRDLPTTLIRGYIPRAILGGSYHWGMGFADFVSARADVLSLTDTRDNSALDPYSFTRDGYLQSRQFLIHDGEIPLDELFDEFDDFDEEFDE